MRLNQEPSPIIVSPPPQRFCMDGVQFKPLFCFYITSLIVFLSSLFAECCIASKPTFGDFNAKLVRLCLRSDALHYRDIAIHGYSYDSETQSTVAFFPAYPLTSRLFAGATGLSIEASMIVVANVCLLASFVILAAYAKTKFATITPQNCTLLAFGLFPATFFFHMPYAESMFILASLLVLFGMTRTWPLLAIALLAGFAAATRPLGVAVSAAVLCHVALRPGSPANRIGRTLVLAPVTTWGLLAYMGYQQWEFGEPLAFAKTQEYWAYPKGYGQHSPNEKIISLLTFEPVYGVYNPDSPRFWMTRDTRAGGVFLFSLTFWNPIIFLTSCCLLAYGYWSGLLKLPEFAYGAVCLAIPYSTRAYEMSMTSHSRFASTVIVIYIAMGKILSTLPWHVSCGLALVSASILTMWTALFVAGYPFF